MAAHVEVIQSLREARERAGREGKRVAVVFGADWCPDCRALDAALEGPHLKPVLDHGFVVVHVDVGARDRNLDLAEQLGIPIRRGIPAVAILDADGSVIEAQQAGEFARARSLTVAKIGAFFAHCLPGGAK